ncbi:NAD(P)-dependent oxidoreductase [Moraxella lacunata]|uniref:NAD(P)-dependent oxidoreductase n=1 Tax=Moraxella lacunata TaxID=477 RepID=UPI003EE23CDC
MGATGLVGGAVVKELAERGHSVTAFARNTDKVYQAHNVQAVAVDVNSPDFADKLVGFDAVVNAFNAGWENPNIINDLQTGHANILSAVKRADVPYVLVVGGAGSLNVAPNLQLVDTPDFPADVYPAANVVRELLGELRTRTDVNWAFLSPAVMFAINPVSFEKTGTYRIGQDDVLTNADGSPADISVADLAVAIADDIEQKAHLHQRFTVAN